MGRLELGDGVTKSLALANALSDEQLRSLASAAVSVTLALARENEALAAAVLDDLDVDLIKRVYSALVCFYIEAAKQDSSMEDIGKFLNKICAFSDSRVKVVSIVFQGKREELRALLAANANYSAMSRLKGVDWSLHYLDLGDQAEKELQYTVKLNSSLDKGTSEELEFVCSVEELQDLVSSLKDACKSVERAIAKN